MADQEQLRLRLRLAKAKAAAAAKGPAGYSPISKAKPPLDTSEEPAELSSGDRAYEAAKPFLGNKTQTGAAVRGLTQGATLGFGDELMGAIDTATAAPEVLEADIGGEPEATSDEEVYRTLRDRYRSDNDSSKKAFPKTYVGGEIAGSFAVPVPGSAAVKGASIAAKLKAAAPGAMLLGGTYGLGTSEAELTDSHVDPAGALKDTAIGAAAAGVGAAGGAAAGRGFEKLASRFGDAAGDAGAKAFGFRPGIDNAAENIGRTAEDMRAMGNDARKAGLIPFGGTKEAVRGRTAQQLNESGQQIGEVYDEFAKSGVPAPFEGIALDASKNIGAELSRDAEGNIIKDTLGRAVRIRTPLAPDQARNSGLANKHINDFVAAGEGPSPGDWSTIRKMKSRAQDTVNPKPDAPMAHKLLEDAVSGTTRGIEDRAGSILGSEQQAKLIGANQRYGLAADVSDFARKAATREQAMKTPGVGLLQGGAMAAGAGQLFGPTAGGAAGALGLAMPFIKRLGDRRGAAVATHALAALETALAEGGGKLPGSSGVSGAITAQEIEAFLEAEAAKAPNQSKPKTLAERFGG